MVTLTEFEVQAFLFMRLNEIGYSVRGEVQSKFLFSDNKDVGRSARFDLVILGKWGKPLEIIEVKPKKTSWPHDRLSQVQRYKRYGLPVLVIDGIKEARNYLAVKTNCFLEYFKQHGAMKPVYDEDG